MHPRRRPPSSLAIVLVGLAALASAMGVGRFAFTPLLPLMQAHEGLSLGQGAWLAGANYLGYAVGALACSVAPPAPDAAARFGLIGVAVSTLAMAATESYQAWLLLRLVAGVASACVLVGVSAWAIASLAECGRAAWSGGVFSGVGIGIAVAGAAGVVAGLDGDSPARVWLVLGAMSSAVAALAWLPLRAGAANATAAATSPQRSSRGEWRLIAGYGAFGFGYIIPATFLPAMAREAIPDPAVFGWVWPAFGAAAAGSTMLVAVGFRGASPQRLWAVSLLVMAAGVISPVLRPGVASLLVAAVCVGGTFMVATLAGMQEARRRAGNAAPRLMAAMTFAFALGQLAGPAIVALNASPGRSGGSAGASLLGALCLFAAAFALREPRALDSTATLREQGQRP